MSKLSKTLLAAGILLSSWATAAHAEYAQIDFAERPGYISNNSISLTFDDGPDWVNTARVLDILRDKGVRATFFINSENWSNIWTEGPMQDLVRRMVNEGHELGNHTQRHDHLPWLSDQEVDAQIRNVQDAVNHIFGGAGPRLTLLRAPHGEPYQTPDGNYDRIASIVARYAVHVGWAVDTFDYNCPQGDGGCVYNSFVSKVGRPGNGAYGSILMHAVHSQTVNALPAIIDYIRNNGFRLVTTEDLVRAKYGRPSWEIVGGGGGGTTPPAGGDVYELVSRYSGKCLDITSASPNNGARAQQWECNRTVAQGFRLRDAGGGRYMLVNIGSGRCLDVDAWGTANGSQIIQWDCHGGNNQLWTFRNSVDGSKSLTSVHAGRCLDIDGPSFDSGRRAQIWDCNPGQANQDFWVNRR